MRIEAPLSRAATVCGLYTLNLRVDNYRVEVLLTLALVSGGYALAQSVHVSGPLAIVAAGILVGNLARNFAMSAQSRDSLDLFWELIGKILNALLFVLISLEVLILRYHPGYFVASFLVVPAVLLARFISVGIPGIFLRLFRNHRRRDGLLLLTWGGLRGGISVALALSLPAGRERELLLTMTYTVAAFSILVQGTTMPWLLQRVLSPRTDSEQLME